MDNSIKVLIVDDSALIRSILKDILSSDEEIQVVDVARDAVEAKEKIKQHNPDVMTLDVEMPGVDGISFLERIMKLRPLPVIMVSTLTAEGSKEAVRALEIGAFDCVEKPTAINGTHTIEKLKQEIIRKVKAASSSNISAVKQTLFEEVVYDKNKPFTRNIIAIGASTGGVEAVRSVLSQLPPKMPPIVIVQHMPAAFTGMFAQRLNDSVEANVVQAKHGDILQDGCIYVTPGDYHMTIERNGTTFSCLLNQEEKYSGHRPSVDITFESIAQIITAKAVAVIMTGMGKDGAKGMLALKNANAINIGQDESSCIVYSMPKAAKDLQAIHKEVHLSNIASEIVKSCYI